ncbi:MAG: serine/threonine-protein kinase RsbW [Kiritimatiellia bacterium]|jgi:serine/threonine-protein kinase RsbW
MENPTQNMYTEGIVSIHLPCHFEYLRIARQSIIDVCARAGLSEYKTAQLEMAIDEACANIIEHSYGHVHNQPNAPDQRGMQLNLIRQQNAIVVEVIDFGKGFAYNEDSVIHPEDYVRDKRERGLGLYIIKNFVDELSYTCDAEKGNLLRLTKNI